MDGRFLYKSISFCIQIYYCRPHLGCVSQNFFHLYYLSVFFDIDTKNELAIALGSASDIEYEGEAAV